MVKRKPPPRGYHKCNTDGVSRGNPSVSSSGFCIRNNRGDLYYAQAGDLGQKTNIQAEANIILEAVRYWEQETHVSKILESNSLIMVMILKRQLRIPWKIIEMVEEIMQHI